MAAKLNAFLRVVAHTMLSFIAALVGGFTFYAYFRPIVGRQRYLLMTKSPIMMAALLMIVALWGVWLYHRWRDRRAFFAWVLPGIWLCHVVLSRGIAALQGQWADKLFFLEIGAAYSAGAVIAAMVVKTPPENHT